MRDFRFLILVAAAWLLLCGQMLAQGDASAGSASVFADTRRIASSTQGQIWEGFDPLRYTSLKSESDGSYISFTNDPDNTDTSWSWRLTDEYFRTHSWEENLIITFHEAFHGFQRDPQRKGKRWGAENARLVFEYQESSARNNALFRIESDLLFKALNSKSERELLRLSREFLAVRYLRQSELSAAFVQFEKGAELNEGLAEYAGIKAVLLAIKAGITPQVGTSADDFVRRNFAYLNRINQVGRNVRRKFYYTGAAQSLLLDRLSKDWRTKVDMEAVPVQDLLATSIGKFPLKDVDLKKYGYAKVLTEEEKLVAEREAENRRLLERTLGQSGRRYVLDFSALRTPAGISFFDPMNVTMVEQQLRVHTRSVTFEAKDVFTAAFSVPVVEDLNQKHYITVLTGPAEEEITADGTPIDVDKLREVEFRNNLTIASPRFKLTATAGSISSVNGTVVIRIKERK